jgi:phospholipid transport system substrate-binding protein
MSKTFATLGFLLATACAMPLALGEELAAVDLMRRISDDVLQNIRADKDLQAGNARKTAALVEAKILPHFDSRRATQAAMGANWRRATPEQQEQLTREFTVLLVRTYSGALASYRNQSIEFRALPGKAGDSETTVRSVIRQGGTEPIVIEYDLQNTGSSWKVFDVRISGISLTATYRTAFAEEVRNRGIDGLINLLSSKNRQV